MAGPGQPEDHQPTKRVDLKATIEKLRAARERLEESRRLFIHKAHLPEPVASSAELELPEVAQRMVGALASKLEKTHSMVYHWNSWTPPTGQAKAILSSWGRTYDYSNLLLYAISAVSLIFFAVLFDQYWYIAIALAVIALGIAVSVELGWLRELYIEQLPGSVLVEQVVDNQLDVAAIRQATAEPWRLLFLREPGPSLEGNVIFAAMHLSWFIKPRRSYISWLWPVSMFSLVIIPVFLAVEAVYNTGWMAAILPVCVLFIHAVYQSRTMYS